MGLVVDKLTGNIFLFDVSGGGTTGTTSGSTYPEVGGFPLLPDPALHNGEIYLVRESTGSYLQDRKEAGLYYSNTLTWRRLGDIPSFFNDDNFRVFNGTDNTKEIKFVVSGLTSGTTRMVSFQNSDGTVAYLSNLTSKLNSTTFNTYTGTTAPNTFLSKSAFNTYSGVTLTDINTRLLKSVFNGYSGTTAPNTYQSKSSIVTLTGTTLPATYVTKIAYNAYTAATLITLSSKLNISIFNGYTGTTAPSLFANKTIFNTYTAATLITLNGKLNASIFNGYTGTTAPATYQSKASIVILTGTTLPATYVAKVEYNVYTAATSTSLSNKLNSSIFNGYTGTTAPATYQTKGSIVTLTGTTLPLTYQSKASIVTLTGTTLPLTYQSKSSIVTLTGTTLPLTYQSKSSIVTLTGTTLPATYVTKVAYNIYTAATLTTLNLTITGATNGLSKTGRNIKLGGAVTGNTTIGLGSNNLTITGGTGSTVITTNIQSALTGAFYLGNSSTNGSWRVTTSGTDLVFQYRESGSWVTKFTIASS